MPKMDYIGTMRSASASERSPLIESGNPASTYDQSSSHSSAILGSPTGSEEGASEAATASRDVEDDVLPETSPLGRQLSWGSAYILVMSRVIGSGIFATPGVIFRSVGSPGLAMLLWIVGPIAAACGLAISLEYGCMLPRSGGEKVYLEFTYRRPRFLASTLVAMQVVLLGFTASNCVVFSQYVLFAAGVDAPTAALRKGVAVGLLATITVIHGCLPKLGVRLQNSIGWVKIAIMIFMILSSVWVLLFRRNGLESSPTNDLSWDHLWDGSVWNWGIISTSFFKVFYSFAGLDNVNGVLNEVKDPVRTLKSVSTVALTSATAMYLMINLAYFLVVPVDEIKKGGELIAAIFFERVFGRGFGRTALPLAVALSAAGNVMVVSFTMARIKQEIARQGFLPFSRLLSSTKPFGSPLGGFVVHFIPSFLVIVLPPSAEIYSFILEVEGYPAQIFSLFLSGGLLWLRYSRPDLKRPFKALTAAVVIKILLSLALLMGPFFPPSEAPENGLFYATYAIVGVGILVVGVGYWFISSVALPHLLNYRLEQVVEVLDDGTSITRIIKKTTYDRPFISHEVAIHDIRGEEDRYSLDGQGFQIVSRPATEREFVDDDVIKSSYYPEVEQLLKDITGASRIFIFDHTIRRKPAGSETRDSASRGPVQRVHIDQSYDAAKTRVPYHLPDDAETLLKGRYQIINVWRPIKTVQRDPLAIADAHSVGEDDLVVTELIYPTRRGETYAVRYNDSHKWYYRSQLSPEQAILIKCFDSKTDGRARRVPHTAFEDPTSAPDAPARESIEVRALVFHPEDQE
ncbi:amino acid permease-domain-containing protein [Stachybotrys elegans]|uniref:Amino acid permease-domain-containing protein n=1 Tax=Stachybotrys elegans TaxID=80388 RepID=A0A8K0WSU6_9HYPO|nr:amino acid permease-domain-containing protein [Stachybotrys elegans]